MKSEEQVPIRIHLIGYDMFSRRDMIRAGIPVIRTWIRSRDMGHAHDKNQPEITPY